MLPARTAAIEFPLDATASPRKVNRAMLQPDLSRQRQRRLLDVMEREKLHVVVVGSAHHVFYFMGYRPFWLHEPALVLQDDRGTTC
jgi:hypothetical protein